MRKIILFVLLICITLVFVSCKKSSVSDDHSNTTINNGEISGTSPGSQQTSLTDKVDSLQKPEPSNGNPVQEPIELDELLIGKWIVISEYFTEQYSAGGQIFTFSFDKDGNAYYENFLSNRTAEGFLLGELPLDSKEEKLTFRYNVDKNMILISNADTRLVLQADIINDNVIYVKTINEDSDEDSGSSFILEKCYSTSSGSDNNKLDLSGEWKTYEDADGIIIFKKEGTIEISGGYGSALYEIKDNKLIIEEKYADALHSIFELPQELEESNVICRPEIFLHSPSVLVLQWNKDDIVCRFHMYLTSSIYINIEEFVKE